MRAPVAQLDRVTDFESVGCRFEPYRAHHTTLIRAFRLGKLRMARPNAGSVLQNLNAAGSSE